MRRFTDRELAQIVKDTRNTFMYSPDAVQIVRRLCKELREARRLLAQTRDDLDRLF